MAIQAVEACLARQRRLHDHGGADLPVAHTGATVGDRPAELVTHDEGRRPGVRAVAKSIHVAAADARALDLDHDLTRAGNGFRHVHHADVSGPVEYGGTHAHHRRRPGNHAMATIPASPSGLNSGSPVTRTPPWSCAVTTAKAAAYEIGKRALMWAAASTVVGETPTMSTGS